jgi:hypothetical protein
MIEDLLEKLIETLSNRQWQPPFFIMAVGMNGAMFSSRVDNQDNGEWRMQTENIKEETLTLPIKVAVVSSDGTRSENIKVTNTIIYVSKDNEQFVRVK